MDALTAQGPPGPELTDCLLYNTNYRLLSRHVFDNRTWSLAQLVDPLGLVNARFQSEKAAFNVGGNALRAAQLLQNGLRWNETYPIPKRIKGRNGKRRLNQAAKKFVHVWWKIAAVDGGSGFWMHAVIRADRAFILKLLSERDVVGIDTADRRAGQGRAARFSPSWTASISDLRSMGLVISTTPSHDGSRYIHRLHVTGRFTPPEAGEKVVHLAVILGSSDLLERSQQQIGLTMDARAVAARARAGRAVAKFRAALAALGVSV